jgi:hypothetical protein
VGIGFIVCSDECNTYARISSQVAAIWIDVVQRLLQVMINNQNRIALKLTLGTLTLARLL